MYKSECGFRFQAAADSRAGHQGDGADEIVFLLPQVVARNDAGIEKSRLSECFPQSVRIAVLYQLHKFLFNFQGIVKIFIFPSYIDFFCLSFYDFFLISIRLSENIFFFILHLINNIIYQ